MSTLNESLRQIKDLVDHTGLCLQISCHPSRLHINFFISSSCDKEALEVFEQLDGKRMHSVCENGKFGMTCFIYTELAENLYASAIVDNLDSWLRRFPDSEAVSYIP